MASSRYAWLYAAWLVLVVIFTLVTGTQLPPTAASHDRTSVS